MSIMAPTGLYRRLSSYLGETGMFFALLYTGLVHQPRADADATCQRNGGHQCSRLVLLLHFQ